MSDGTSALFQLFPALDPATESALRASIRRWGVLVPVAKDQHGRILDGHHRSRIADEERVKYAVLVHHVESDEDAQELARTLNTDRRHLDREQRREMAVQLRSEGHSLRAIGQALGADKQTILRDVESVSPVSGETPEQPARVRGSDGKKYPATKPRPVPTVFARDEAQAKKAQQALTDIGSVAPGKVIDTKRAERIAREKAAEERRAEPIEEITGDADVEIRHGDFRIVLDDIEPGTVDAIITDPPYPAEFWRDQYTASNVYVALGEIARHLLKPSGVLAVMIGTRLEMLDAVDAQIGRNMRRRHRGIYLVPGQRWRDQVERVATGYKPILIFAHPDGDPSQRRWINDDVFVGGGDDKRFHHWGQSESGMASIVARLTEPGELVVDPFLGGGTMAVVCRDLSRRFIGCDIDANAVTVSRERVA